MNTRKKIFLFTLILLLIASQLLQLFVKYYFIYLTISLAAVLIVASVLMLIKSKLFVRIASCVALALSLFLFVPNILVLAHSPSENHGFVMHAGGANEFEYLNCQETFLAYSDQKYIELDFLFTSDDKVVCSHTFEHLGNFSMQNRPTLQQFESTLLEGKYHGITFGWLIEQLKTNENVQIIFDTKEDNLDILSSMVEEAQLNNFDIFSRFIVQVYSKEDYLSVKQHFPFKEFWFTNYKAQYLPSKIEKHFGKCDDVTTYVLWKTDWWLFASSYQKTSKNIAVHTVNDKNYQDFLYDNGVDLIYVDRIN